MKGPYYITTTLIAFSLLVFSSFITRSSTEYLFKEISYYNDLPLISQEIRDPNSTFYYPKIKHKFNDSYLSINDQEIAALIYGNLLFEKGNLDKLDSIETICNDLLKNKNYRAGLETAKKHHNQFPASTVLLNTLWLSYQDLQDSTLKNINFHKLDKLLDGMNKSGSANINEPKIGLSKLSVRQHISYFTAGVSWDLTESKDSLGNHILNYHNPFATERFIIPN